MSAGEQINRFPAGWSVVEYRGKKDGVSPLHWEAMAAFDQHGVAEAYAKSCGGSDFWEYQARQLATEVSP